MDSFCVLHITKYKGDLGSIGAHLDRLHIPTNANEQKVGFNEELYLGERQELNVRLQDILGTKIDPTKRDSLEKHPLNKGSDSLPLSAAVARRIQEGHTISSAKTGKIETIRKDAVLALGVILTGSHERMHAIAQDPVQFNAWKKANYAFMCQQFGAANIVRFVLHLDEKTPHIHAVVVPISPAGRLSGRSFTNGGPQLRHLQDLYAQTMEPFGLMRGIAKELTERVHVDTADWRREQNQQLQQSADLKLVSSIKKTNLFQLDKVQQEVKEAMVKLHLALFEQTKKNEQLAIINKNLMEERKGQAYQKTLEETSHWTYEWIKRNIPLAPFLTQQLKWVLNESASTDKDVVLVHPASKEKILIPTSLQAATGYWEYSYVHGGKGTLIDLLLQEKWSWQAIRALADGKCIATPHPSEEAPRINHLLTIDPALQTQAAQRHLATILPARKSALLEQRGIVQDTYQDLEGVKIGQQAAVFSLYKDFDNKGQAQLCSTFTCYSDRLGNPHTYLQQGLPKGLSVLQEKNKSWQEMNRIVVTKSPIGALSYRQMELTGAQGWKITQKELPHAANHPSTAPTAWVSICGKLTGQNKRDLAQIFYRAHAHNQTVVLALDNSLAGKKMREVLSHMLEEAHGNYCIEVPYQGKSWHDRLVRQGAVQAQASSKYMAQRQWDLFEEITYTSSLLYQLGVEKATHQAFQKTVKTNEKAVLVALLGDQQAIMATWSLDRHQQEGRSEIAPSLSILKGDVKQASQLVLATSPLAALLHYQQQEIKPAKICYVYANTHDPAQLARPLMELVEQAASRQVMVVGSNQHAYRIQAIEQILQEQKRAYTHVAVELAPSTEQPSLIHQQWEKFSEKPYAHSLLPFLGINKATYEVFQETIKVNKKAILIALEKDQNKKKVLATWLVQQNPQKGYEVQLSDPPALSVLQGNLNQAEKVILVTSPLDALLHYQKQATPTLKPGKSCYVYVPVVPQKALQDSTQELGKLVKGKTVVLASNREHAAALKNIESILQEKRMPYQKEGLLGASLALISTLMYSNTWTEEDEREEGHRKRKRQLQSHTI